MKQRFLISVLSSILVVVFTTIPHATRSYAQQCKCTCHWTCAGSCPYSCTGCGLGEGAEAGERCCDQAPAASNCGGDDLIIY